MSELILGLSENFHHEADSIRAELSKHVKVGQPQLFAHFSADPPSYVQLLGDAGAWQVLRAAAVVFLTAAVATLGKRATDAIWDKIANRNDVKPLADVATTLATAVARVDREGAISFGLNIPDDYFGTSIRIKSSDPGEVAHVLACFLVHVDQLSTVMQAEVAAGRAPFGPAIIARQDDESLVVRWKTQDGRAHELQIPHTK